MYFFRRFALLLALTSPAIPTVLAQSSSNTSGSADPSQAPSSSSQSGVAQQSAAETQGQVNVQQRIRLRREQRRATAIHDAYDHKWETYMDMGYLRFQPGPSLQRLTYYAWQTGLTQVRSERLGYTLEGRGYFGTAYVGLNTYSQGAFTRPAISQYDVLFGPVYRFYLQPRYAVSGRVMGGWAHGNFSGDTNGISPPLLGLYPDANTYAISASVIGEYNISPAISLKLAPEYFFTGFGSTVQASRGFTAGMVYRFGKQ
jgi:hypothetical protein